MCSHPGKYNVKRLEPTKFDAYFLARNSRTREIEVLASRQRVVSAQNITIFRKLVKQESLAQDIQYWQMLTAFEKRELHIDLSPRLASHHNSWCSTTNVYF